MTIDLSTPFWIRASRAVISRLPAGRYMLMNTLVARMSKLGFAPRAFVTRSSRTGNRFVCELRDSIAREVCFTGQYEPLETLIVERILRHGDVLVDVGANWGYFTLLGAKLVGPTGRVLCLEPDPRLHEMLLANVRLNGCGNVIAERVAAAAGDAIVTLHGFVEAGGNWGLSSLSVVIGGPTFTVPARRLDALLVDHGIGDVRLIKLDIEGAEGAALRGMTDGLRDGQYQSLILELHPGILAERGVKIEEVLAPLVKANYRGWRIEHSLAATRRAAYQRVRELRALLQPVDTRDLSDVWPHQLWLRPGLDLDDVL